MSQLIGQNMNKDAKIDAKIEELVNLVSEHSSHISGLKDADQEDAAQKDIKLLEEMRGRPLFYPYLGSGIGKGSYVETNDGAIKMDLINGIGINIFGHSHPEVMKAAVKGAVQDVVMQGNLEPGNEMVRMSEKLVEIATRKSRLNHCWITTSGSMANENALKMCRQKTGAARMVIAMRAAFAGRTTMMAEVTDNPSMREGLPEYNEILRVPFFDKNNPNSTEEATQILKDHIKEHKGNIAGFIFEPIQGEGGYNVAPREFFVPLLELCRENGIPVWADEIQTFCRTGEFFAFDKLGLSEYIDICTVAKTLQAAATLYTDELNPKPGLIAGTFAGSSAALAAGRKILDILDTEDYMGKSGKVESIHKEFVAMLNELNEGSCKGLLQDAGGMGLMVAVTPLDGTRESMIKVLKTLYKNGIISFGCGRGPFRVRFLIPAVMTSDDIQVAKKVIEKSILELA